MLSTILEPEEHAIPQPSRKHMHDPEYWLQRAEEALEIALEMTDAFAISKMLRVVRRYEYQARQAYVQREVSFP
jgi:hypothetical protein